MIFKTSLNVQDYINGKYHNKSLNTQYVDTDKNGKDRFNDFTGEVINSVVAGTTLVAGYNYFNLPDIHELYEGYIQKREK